MRKKMNFPLTNPLLTVERLNPKGNMMFEIVYHVYPSALLTRRSVLYDHHLCVIYCTVQLQYLCNYSTNPS